MKPQFALSLSFEGIRLLHRGAGGWLDVGGVTLTTSDLAGELAELRKTASVLEPGNVRTKLIIPNDQIKYMTIDTKGFSRKRRVEAARAALVGATPYKVRDLSFDICPDGPRTHVAAVANETLAEAETFAAEHRFNPISFVAIPGNEAFMGEPFFGPTPSSAELLANGDRVEPDGIAVVVVGRVAASTISEIVSAAPPPEETADPEDNIEAADAGATPTPKSIPEAPKDDAPMEFVEQAIEETPEEPADPVSDVGLDEAAPDPDQPDETQAEPSEDDDYAAEEPEIAEKLADIAAPVIAEPGEEQPEADVSLADEPVPETPPAPAGFASRRTVGRDPLTARRDTVPGGPVPKISLQPDSSSLDQPPPPVEAPVASREVPAAAHEDGDFLSGRNAPALAAATTADTKMLSPEDEADRLTVFGARKGDEIGGKPRFLGLILTAVLLIFLAGVAAWATVFLDDGLAGLFNGRKDRAIASAPENQIEPQIIRVSPETSEGVQTASLDPELTTEDTAVLDALSEPEPAPLPTVITEAEAEARYAVTGIWPLPPEVPTPPGTIPLDDFYLTSIDPVSTASDAVALPPARSFTTDNEVPAIASPAAPGTNFALDAQGLVIPTAAGAVSPDGVIVYLGRPPVIPPVTPTRFLTEPQVDTERAALAGLRPRERPANLAESNERAQLDGLTRSELAEFRPQLRPQSVQQTAEKANADRAAIAAAAAAAASALEAPQDVEASPFATATRFAVNASVRPDVRPRNFDRIVQRARRDAPQITQATATVAPRTVAPKIPSSASVAKQATINNALNLRKVNLIGVYGKPSSRRALVRLGNGRYKKVVVGDRIDGGRVSAIGDSELRYTKGGRAVVLKMPKG